MGLSIHSCHHSDHSPLPRDPSPQSSTSNTAPPKAAPRAGKRVRAEAAPLGADQCCRRHLPCRDSACQRSRSRPAIVRGPSWSGPCDSHEHKSKLLVKEITSLPTESGSLINDSMVAPAVERCGHHRSASFLFTPSRSRRMGTTVRVTSLQSDGEVFHQPSRSDRSSHGSIDHDRSRRGLAVRSSMQRAWQDRTATQQCQLISSNC